MTTSNTVTKTDLENIINAIFPATTEDMTQAQIDAFVASLNCVGINAVDYVVEEGTATVSGRTWNYRKWNSGRAECWLEEANALTVTTARGSIYSSSWIAYTFPFVFNSRPTVLHSASMGTDAYVIWTQIKDLTTTAVSVRVASSGSLSTSTSYEISVYAIGTLA